MSYLDPPDSQHFGRRKPKGTGRFIPPVADDCRERAVTCSGSDSTGRLVTWYGYQQCCLNDSGGETCVPENPCLTPAERIEGTCFDCPW